MEINQLKAGAILSYVSMFLSNAISIFLTPFIINSLGKSEYGLYTLIGTFVTYVAILDFGLGNSITRYVAKYRAEDDKAKESNLISISLIIYGAIGLLAIIVGAVLYSNLGFIFGKGLTPVEISKAQVMFAILLFNIVISFPINSFNAVILGYEEFVFTRCISIFRLIVCTSLIFLFLSAGYKAIAIIMINTIFNFLTGLVYALYVLFKLKVKIKLYYFDKAFFSELARFSLFIFLSMVVDQLYWRTGQIILGIFIGTASVTIFALSVQFCTYYIQFSTSIAGVFLPRVTKLAVKNATDMEMTELFVKTSRVQMIIMGFILLSFSIFGREFITLWLGTGYTDVWNVTLIMMVPLTVPLIQTVGLSILQAKNMHGFRSVMYVVIAAINAVIAIFTVNRIGTYGAAIGTSLSLILGNIIVINLYYHYKVKLNIPYFIRKVSSRLVTSILLAGGIGLLTLFFPCKSWITLIIKGLIFTNIYVLIMWFYGMNAYEKTLVSKPLGKLVMRFKDYNINYS